MSAHSLCKIHNLTLLFLVVTSIFGLTLTILFALYPPITQEDLVWRKPLVGSAFSIVCILGTIAVFFPNICSKFFDFSHRNKSISDKNALALQGHHPMCGRFSTHVFSLGNEMLCATCSGLFTGALFALAGVTMYFFGSWQVGQNAFLMVLVGAFGVAFGLLQSPLPLLQKSVIRVFSSAFFVVGTFLILVGIEELTHNTSIDLFLVVLSVLWLATRISLSQWDHRRICAQCPSDSCSYVNH